MPFLLKVLAIERPLSLQAHPDAARARDGFARPAVGGVRVYADPHAKPELVCALTAFTALCGFLPLAELRARFTAVGLAALVPDGDDEASVLFRLLDGWLGAPSGERSASLARAVEAAGRRADSDPACARVCELAARFPGDPGALAPLFLHEVRLAPGEALFLAPGVLHSYLGGVALELMPSSDNVLRGGLTAKPVHVAELLRVLRFECAAPTPLRAGPREPGEGVWRTPAAEFELAELRPSAQAPVAIAARAGVEVLWCAEGELHVATAGGAGLALRRGESCLVPAAAGPYRVAGAGRAFRAGVPLVGKASGAEPASGRRSGAAKRRPCGS
jgi:mannose-6-phosphate isomerase